MTKNPMVQVLKKLSHRSYSRNEIFKTLENLETNQDEANQIVEKLQGWGYLDDKEMAKRLTDYYREQKGYGPYVIRQKLGKKLIPTSIIEEVLEKYDLELEEIAANKAAHQFIMRNDYKENREWIAPLARHLARKGFSSQIIHKILLNKGLDPNM